MAKRPGATFVMASMSTLVERVHTYLKQRVAPHLETQPSGLGFAIGYASPDLPKGDFFLAGNLKNQLGVKQLVTADTPFAIASVTKTFSATLYALRVPASDRNLTIADYALPVSQTLGGITLDSLVNYTSGLPNDNKDAASSTPPYWPKPYSMAGLMSYLKESPPQPAQPGKQYTYSNLAFALMGAILSRDGKKGVPTVEAFVNKMADSIFKTLGLKAMFFDQVSLADLPRGYLYDYTADPVYTARQPGWDFFPAYYAAGGMIASANDMLKWLRFNMGLIEIEPLTKLLPALQGPPYPDVQDDEQNSLGRGWFINKENDLWTASVSKDGDLDHFRSFIAFAPSENPGTDHSKAGAFVLVNAHGITETQTQGGTDLAERLVDDVLRILQGRPPVRS